MSQQTPQSHQQQSQSYYAQDNLSNLDIYNVFKQRGFNIDSEKAISEPTQEFFNNILVFSTSLLLKIPIEEINQSSMCEQGDYEIENSLKTLHCFQKMKYIRQMLELIGIDDISTCDIIKLDKKKVRKTIVAITQYILYQESVIKNHIEMLEKNRADEMKIKRYGEELETLRFHSDQLKERKEAEKNIFQEKMQLLEKLQSEYQELMKQKLNQQKEKQEQQSRKISMEKAIRQAEEDIRKMIDANLKERMKIVKSPFKLKDQCQQLQDEIELSIKELDQIKSEFQFLSIKKSYNDKLLQKIQKHLTLPSLTLTEIIKKDTEANKILKNAKNEIKELQLKEENSHLKFVQISENNMDLVSQLDQKNKIQEEKRKTYDDESNQLLREQSKLKEQLAEVQQTITEITLMKKNLESNAHDQEKIHEAFMREKKLQMEDLIDGLKDYKNDIYLLIDQENNN